MQFLLQMTNQKYLRAQLDLVINGKVYGKQTTEQYQRIALLLSEFIYFFN